MKKVLKANRGSFARVAEASQCTAAEVSMFFQGDEATRPVGAERKERIFRAAMKIVAKLKS